MAIIGHMKSTFHPTEVIAEQKIPRHVQQRILRAVADIRYGSVEVVIQDGKVVQIESREKQRINFDSEITA